MPRPDRSAIRGERVQALQHSHLRLHEGPEAGPAQGGGAWTLAFFSRLGIT